MTNHLWVCRETNASGFLKEVKKKKKSRAEGAHQQMAGAEIAA